MSQSIDLFFVIFLIRQFKFQNGVKFLI